MILSNNYVAVLVNDFMYLVVSIKCFKYYYNPDEIFHVYKNSSVELSAFSLKVLDIMYVAGFSLTTL